MDSRRLSINMKEEDGRVVVCLEGILDGNSRIGLAGRITGLSRTPVYLDVSRVTAMDVPGLWAIATAYDRMRAKGHDLRIVNVPPAVRKLFEAIRLEDILYDSDSAPRENVPAPAFSRRAAGR